MLLALIEAMYCRALACDFDGTVANDGHLAPEVAAVPVASLVHHLEGGDFSRWASDVIGDAVLAAGFRKLEHGVQDGGRPSRAEILAQVAARYHVDGAPASVPALAPALSLPAAAPWPPGASA